MVKKNITQHSHYFLGNEVTIKKLIRKRVHTTKKIIVDTINTYIFARGRYLDQILRKLWKSREKMLILQ